MNLLRKYLYLLTMGLILFGCASVGIEERKELRDLVAKNQYDKAIEVLEKGKIKKDEKSQILYLMELGRLYFGKGDFTLAGELFQKASDLIEAYYTKSISQKLGSSTLNENIENYYGEIYEVSMLHYYLAQSYFKIYQTGKITEEKTSIKDKKEIKTRVEVEINDSKKKQYLFMARAVILAWDTYYKDIQRSGKKTVFKSDLMIKLFGASIHEVIGTPNELSIALQLYKDAKKVLYTVFNILESYNKKYKDYTADRLKDYDKLVEFIPNRNFDPTESQNQLKDFIDSKILYLTKKLNPSSFNNIVKAESIRPEVVKNLETNKNVSIFIEHGLISQKVPKIVNIGLEGAMNSVESPGAKAMIQAVGVPVLTYFAMNVLGIVPKNRAMTYGEFVYARNFSELAVRALAVEFEVPMVEKSPTSANRSLVVLNNQGVVVAAKPLVLVTPVGDIAYQNLEESAVSRMITKGVRVAVKHIVAITAAYGTYKSMRDRGQEAFASTVATVQYFASAKGILASERADTRYWSTIPQNITEVDFNLPEGIYQLKLQEIGSDKKPVEFLLGQINVAKGMNLFTYFHPKN